MPVFQKQSQLFQEKAERDEEWQYELDKRLSWSPVVNQHHLSQTKSKEKKKCLNIVINVFSWPNVSKKENY